MTGKKGQLTFAAIACAGMWLAHNIAELLHAYNCRDKNIFVCSLAWLALERRAFHQEFVV